MYQKKIQENIRCPLEYCLGQLNGKWKFRIVCVLSDGEQHRYQDIKKDLGDISDSVLSAALKEMNANGLITRTSFDEVPPYVVYSLTEKGMSVTPLMQSMCRWSSMYYDGSREEMLPRCISCENSK